MLHSTFAGNASHDRWHRLIACFAARFVKRINVKENTVWWKRLWQAEHEIKKHA